MTWDHLGTCYHFLAVDHGEPYINLPQKLLFIDFCSNSEGDISFPVPVVLLSPIKERKGSLEMTGHPFAIPLEMEAPMALLEALYFQGGPAEKSCEDPGSSDAIFD